MHAGRGAKAKNLIALSRIQVVFALSVYFKSFFVSFLLDCQHYISIPGGERRLGLAHPIFPVLISLQVFWGQVCFWPPW